MTDFGEEFHLYSRVNIENGTIKDALIRLATNRNVDMVLYRVIQDIMINDSGETEIRIDRSCDIITNFLAETKEDISVELIVNNTNASGELNPAYQNIVNIGKIKKDTIIIPVYPVFSAMFIRFTSKRPVNFKFSYDGYLCQNNIRLDLSERECIHASGILYKNRMIVDSYTVNKNL